MDEDTEAALEESKVGRNFITTAKMYKQSGYVMMQKQFQQMEAYL